MYRADCQKLLLRKTGVVDFSPLPPVRVPHDHSAAHQHLAHRGLGPTDTFADGDAGLTCGVHADDLPDRIWRYDEPVRLDTRISQQGGDRRAVDAELRAQLAQGATVAVPRQEGVGVDGRDLGRSGCHRVPDEFGYLGCGARIRSRRVADRRGSGAV